MAWGIDDGTVRIRDASNHPTYPSLKTLNVPYTVVQEVHFNKESNKLIVCGDNGYKIYSVPGWAPLAEVILGHPVLSCRFAPDGKYAIGTQQGEIRLYSSAYVQQWRHLSDNSALINSIDFSPDSQHLMTGWETSNSKVVIFSVGSNSSGVVAHTGSDEVYAVGWSDDGSVTAFGMANGQTRLKNGTEGQYSSLVTSLTRSGDMIYTLDFSYQGNTLAMGGKDDIVYIYKGPTPTPTTNTANTTNSTNTTNTNSTNTNSTNTNSTNTNSTTNGTTNSTNSTINSTNNTSNTTNSTINISILGSPGNINIQQFCPT